MPAATRERMPLRVGNVLQIPGSSQARCGRSEGCRDRFLSEYFDTPESICRTPESATAAEIHEDLEVIRLQPQGITKSPLIDPDIGVFATLLFNICVATMDKVTPSVASPPPPSSSTVAPPLPSPPPTVYYPSSTIPSPTSNSLLPNATVSKPPRVQCGVRKTRSRIYHTLKITAPSSQSPPRASRNVLRWEGGPHGKIIMSAAAYRRAPSSPSVICRG